MLCTVSPVTAKFKSSFELNSCLHYVQLSAVPIAV